MPVVTIRGQLGSGAPEIGMLVAEKLHVDYVDRGVIAKVAEILSAPQQDVVTKEIVPGSLFERIAAALGGDPISSGYGLGDGYEGAAMPVEKISLDDTSYLVGLESAIKELAASSSIVICGRGSQFILKNQSGVVNVLTVAPLEMRVKRVMEIRNLGKEAAKKVISLSDGNHRAFIKRYFKADIEDPVNYDLVLNTERLSYEIAASTVAELVRLSKPTEPKQ